MIDNFHYSKTTAHLYQCVKITTLLILYWFNLSIQLPLSDSVRWRLSKAFVEKCILLWETKGGRQMCKVYVPLSMLYLLDLAGTRAVIWPRSILPWLKANLPRPSQAHRINICWPVTWLCPYITVFCCWLDSEAVKFKTRVKLHTEAHWDARWVSEVPHWIYWQNNSSYFACNYHLLIQYISAKCHTP